MNSNQNIIILGPPGSGKGTQAKLLAKRLSYVYFGTGDLMREEAEKGTELGKKFQEIWDNNPSALVDERLVSELVETKINNLKEKNIIFDGWPRTMDQAQGLEKIYRGSSKDFIVINIKVSPESLVERVATRRVCSKCDKIFYRPEEKGVRQCDVCAGNLVQRKDDRPEIIKNRIEVYNKQTQPLIEYYKNKGILVEIDGEPPIEEVEKEIITKLNG